MRCKASASAFLPKRKRFDLNNFKLHYLVLRNCIAHLQHVVRKTQANLRVFKTVFKIYVNQITWMKLVTYSQYFPMSKESQYIESQPSLFKMFKHVWGRTARQRSSDCNGHISLTVILSAGYKSPRREKKLPYLLDPQKLKAACSYPASYQTIKSSWTTNKRAEHQDCQSGSLMADILNWAAFSQSKKIMTNWLFKIKTKKM